MSGIDSAVPGHRRSGIGAHHAPVQGATDEWLTPPSIIEALGPFDLDPLDAYSVSGDPAPRREAREEVAGTLGGGAGKRGWAPDTDRMTFVPEVGHAGQIVMAPSFSKRQGQQIATRDDGVSYALSTGEPPRVLSLQDVRPMDKAQGGSGVRDEVGYTLDTTGSQGVMDGTAQVRRLTPKECERLQGFPDDWTRYDAEGKEMSDSARYRMMGNAVCVAVSEWIGRRLAEVMS